MVCHGPPALAVDYMVFNLRKDDSRASMAVVNDDAWPLPSVTEKLPADTSGRFGFTRSIQDGRQICGAIIESAYKETNENFGTISRRRTDWFGFKVNMQVVWWLIDRQTFCQTYSLSDRFPE